MKKLTLLMGIAVVVASCAIFFQLGYMHGSYVKNRDLEMSYEDGYANAKHTIGPDEMRQR